MSAGSRPMADRIKGVNKVRARLADGSKATYYYHRATGTKLPGEFGSAAFIAALAEAQKAPTDRDKGTLAGLIRGFERTPAWRELADSTKKEYRRVFKFWEGKFGKVPMLALAAKGFRRDVLQWHADYSQTYPREADNRVTVLARVLAWGARDDDLQRNVLDTFERAYSADRSEMIWLPDHVEAFMKVASGEMQLAMLLALHTGQRQADIRKMAWTNYDGQSLTLRQGKSGRRVVIPCTKALKGVLDGLRRRGAVILTTTTGRAFQKRYLADKWDAAYTDAGLPRDDKGRPVLHFHDVRGTTVTMLFEAGCTVAEAASITGHSLRRAQDILDRYLARTAVMAESAIAKLENRMEQEPAKRPAKGVVSNDAK